jgi:hypothetical protein
MTTAAQLNKGQAGGLAVIQKYGQEHMQAIGRKGGRPRALTVKDIIPEAASADSGNGKGQRHGKSLKELLRLWRERQAASGIAGEPSGAACLHNGERSSPEDSQHLGVGEHTTSRHITLCDSTFTTQPTIASTPAPGREE